MAVLQPHSPPTRSLGGCPGPALTQWGLSGEAGQSLALYQSARPKAGGDEAQQVPRASGATEGESGGEALSCPFLTNLAAGSLPSVRGGPGDRRDLAQAPGKADLLWSGQGHPAREQGPGEGFGLTPWTEGTSAMAGTWHPEEVLDHTALPSAGSAKLTY